MYCIIKIGIRQNNSPRDDQVATCDAALSKGQCGILSMGEGTYIYHVVVEMDNVKLAVKKSRLCTVLWVL